MASAPDHNQSTPSVAGEPHERDEPVEPTEQFGPLAVSRHVKGDGRALILYTLREHPELGERADETGARSDEPGERPT